MYKKRSVFSIEDCYRTLELVRRRIPYKIHIKPSSQSSSKNHVEEVLLLSEIKDLKEAVTFIDAYETLSQSYFHIISSKNDPNRSVCSRKWICNHGIVSGLNKTCSASISILIKKFHSESMLEDDMFKNESPLPAVIRINPNHNHRLAIPLPAYKLLKLNKDVKICFYEYFKRGYFGSRAKQLHQQYLRKAKFSARKDESMNPTVQAIYTLANNWLKMKDSVEVDKASDNERFGYTQAGIIKKEDEIEQASSQNTENVVNIDDVVAKLKMEPNDEYIIPDNSFNEILEPQTILTIDEDDDGFPVISNEQSSQNFINIDDVVAKLKKEPDDEYTSAQNNTNEILGVQPVLTIKQEIIDEDEKAGLPVISSYSSLAVLSPPTLPLEPPLVKTSTVNRTAKATTESASTVGKVVQPPSSQVVIYGLSPNTYKVVKHLSVNSGTYSASQYKSYSPNVLAPMRISLQKF